MPTSLVCSPNYKYYVLGILSIILLFNYVDRVALGILLQAIKHDFDLSDTQLGLLGGFAFALFYSIMGLPIARLADAGNRVTIIALACILWSAAVAVSGLASNFLQLLLVRVVVAVGEAGCVPPALSLMADYFNRAERPRAVALYGLGGVFALFIGFFLGGWLNEQYGWRVTFVALGMPGVLLGLLAWLTVREPRCGRSAASCSKAVRVDLNLTQHESATSHPTAAAVCSTVLTNMTFRRLLLCLCGLLFFNVGFGQWMPAFFIRTHGFTSEQVGAWLAIVAGSGGLLGAYAGGAFASHYAENNESLQLKAAAVTLCLAGVATLFACVTSNAYIALTFFGVYNFGLYAINGPIMATMQTLVPERMRAMAFAIAFLLANLLGMGFGPLAVGALSDLYQSWAHHDSLRYALLTLAPGYFSIAWCAWRGSNSVVDDVAQLMSDAQIESSSEAASVRVTKPHGVDRVDDPEPLGGV